MTMEHDKIISLRLSVELYERLQAEAFRRSTTKLRVTVSELIREAIEGKMEEGDDGKSTESQSPFGSVMPSRSDEDRHA